MNEDTPQKKNYINDTIQNTPLPQACSTIQKTDVYGNNFDVTSEMYKQIDHSLNTSALSTTSSLGILNLDNANLDLLNFNKEEHVVPAAAANSTNKLLTQRNLALKAMERADKKSSEYQNMPKLPNTGISYLLQPNAATDQSSYLPAARESIFNISDIPESSNTLTADVSPDKMDKDYLVNVDLSQSVQEILAASCFEDVKDTLNNFHITETSTQDIWNKDDGVFGNLSFAGEQCVESNDFSFTPSEEVPDMLMANELSWRRKCADLPIDIPPENANQNNKKDAKHDFSCFSEYIPQEDSLRNAPSMSTFFHGRSDNLTQILPSITSKCNSDFLEQTGRTTKDFEEAKLANIDSYSRAVEELPEDNESVRASIISISSIEKIVYQDDENTPRRIMDLLLQNNKHETNKLFHKESIIAGNIKTNDNKLPGELSNDSLKNIEATSIFSSTLNTQDLDLVPNKENKNPVTHIQNQNDGIKKKANNNKRQSLQKLSNNSNLPSNSSASRSNNSNKMKFNWDSEIPYDSSSTQFHCGDSLTSAGGEVYKAANKGSYLTIPKIDTQLCYKGCSTEVPLILISNSQKGFFVKIMLKEISALDTEKKIDTGLTLKVDSIDDILYLKPKQQMPINIIVSGLAISFVKVSLELQISNEMTRDISSLYAYDFYVKVCNHRISVKISGGDSLNFADIPENCSTDMMVNIINDGPTDVEICTRFKPFTHPQYFKVHSITPNECTTEITTHTHSFKVPSKGNVQCKIRFTAHKISETYSLKKIFCASTFNISLVSINNSLLIQSIKTTGTVTKYYMKFTPYMYPLELRLGETEAIEIKNFGLSSVSFKVFIATSREYPQECKRNIFKLDCSFLNIEPGEVGAVNVTFAKIIPEQRCFRELALQEIRNGPIEFWPIVGVRDIISRNIPALKNCRKHIDANILSPLLSNLEAVSPNKYNKEPITDARSLNYNEISATNTISPSVTDNHFLRESNQNSSTMPPSFLSRLSPGGSEYKKVTTSKKSKTVSPKPNHLLSTKSSEDGSRESKSDQLQNVKYQKNLKLTVPSTNSSYVSTSSRSSGERSDMVSPSSPRPALYDGEYHLNKLPIRASENELSWPSIKKGKQKCKEIVFKNISSKKLKVVISVVGDGFSIVKDRETSKHTKTVLQGSEVRTLTVMFEAASVGVFVGKITFSSGPAYSSRTIMLSAFGGHAEIAVNGVFKHPNGTQFLSLGELKLQSLLSKTIKLYNNGTVSGFAIINVEHMGKLSLISPEIRIHPQEVVIPPGADEAITVSICPKKDWLNKLNSDVISIGSLSIVTGDEGMRQRIRKIYNADKERETDRIWKNIKPLCKEFNDEEPTFQSLPRLQETKDVLPAIYSGANILEIGLTVERSSNTETSNTTLMAPDETLMLRTLLSE